LEREVGVEIEGRRVEDARKGWRRSRLARWSYEEGRKREMGISWTECEVRMEKTKTNLSAASSFQVRLTRAQTAREGLGRKRYM